MKRHDIKNSEIDRLGGQVPDYTLCIYEAELGDLWPGFVAAEAGWDAVGSPPEPPMRSYGAALAWWVKQHPKTSTGI